jgi:hypothetical protein
MGFGCATVHTEKVARFSPAAADEKRATVEMPGVYKVRWRRASTDALSPVHGTSRYLTVGTTVGFEQQTDGAIVAVAGDERIRLPAGPSDAKYVMWHSTWEERTELGEGLADFADGAGKVLIVASVVGLLFVIWTLDDRDVGGVCHKHRRHDCRRCR